MHREVHEWVVQHLPPHPFTALEFGSLDVNGTLPLGDSTGIDLTCGPNVDIVGDAATYRHHTPVDVVVCAEVLEHATNPAELIESARLNLDTPGTLILTCAGPGRPPHGAHGAPRPAPGEHYANITPTELAAWFQSAGFESWDIVDAHRDLYAIAST